MAEAWFRHHANRLNFAVESFSAGISPKGIHPLAVQVMGEVGIDISEQKSEPVENYINGNFDYVITVCDKAAANCPFFGNTLNKIHWPFEDPDAATGTDDEIIAGFRCIRDQIGEKIYHWIESGIAR